MILKFLRQNLSQWRPIHVHKWFVFIFFCCNIAPQLTHFHSNLSNTPIDEIFVKWVSWGVMQQKLYRENIMYRHDLAFDATVMANIFLKSLCQKDHKFQKRPWNLKFYLLYGTYSNFYSSCGGSIILSTPPFLWLWD